MRESSLSKEQQKKTAAVKESFAQCGVEASFRLRELEEFMLETDKEAGLRTVIYRPETNLAVPVIVVRSPYAEMEFVQRTKAEEYAKRGFGYIYQYCRGTGGSGGTWEPNINERKDGKALLDWVCDQEWVKSVGFLGSSYLALTGWVIADIVPEKVKTMYLTHYGTVRHTSAYMNGAFRQDVLTSWAMGNAGIPISADYEASCKFRPQISVDVKLWGRELDWYRQWILNPGREDAYWQKGFWKLLREIPKKISIPLFVGEGWFDHHLASALETWDMLSEECKKKSTLCIGGWSHSFENRLEGQTCFHFDADDDRRAFQWFYHILKKEEKPQGKILKYVIGADCWKSMIYGEKERTVPSRYYLSYSNGQKKLEKNPDLTKKKEVSFVYNPEEPVKSVGGEALLRSVQVQGSRLQPKPDYRSDVLSFLSDELGEPLEISGQIRVHLSVATSAEDTAFTVKVMEVMPDGKAYNLRTGITTLGYRNGTGSCLSYHSGSKENVEIVMWEIAWQLQKGSRIRIDISSSDFPQYNIHSNYAGLWALQEKTKTAVQTIFVGGESFLEIPTVPRGKEKE